MLKRKFRIPKGESFAKAYDVHFPLFFLKIKTQPLSYSRCGVVISKKIDKRATVRNRMRRVMSSIFEHHRLYENKGYDMLFILKKPFDGSREDLEQMVLSAVKTGTQKI